MAVGNRSQNGYSENDLLRMQQDAMRRVRAMQEQAQRTLEGQFLAPPGGRPSPSSGAPRLLERDLPRPVPPVREPLPSVPHRKTIPAQEGNFLTSLLSSINLDNGQLLTLGILAILFLEKADPALLIALGYIIL